MGISRNSILLAGCAMLGACGGGGVNSTPTPTPTPVPTPTPAPTPTPTPSPTPTSSFTLKSPSPPTVIPQETSGTLAAALQSAQGFLTGSLELDADYTEGWISSRNTSYGASSSLKLYVDPDAGTSTVYDTLGGGVAFTDGSRTTYDGWTSWGLNSMEAGRKLRYSLPDQPLDRFPDVQLTYAGYGVSFVDSRGRGSVADNDQHDLATFFYFGIPTASSNVPLSGTADYGGVAEGRLYNYAGDYEVGDYDLKGTATLTADFGTGRISTTLLLDASDRSGGGGQFSLGSFEGFALLMSGESAFQGLWTASSEGYEGSISGSFFGPDASEFGYTFGINKPDLSAIGGGVVVGGQDTAIPPPPPPPPPDPPPPAPAGSTFPLASAQTFEAHSATLSYSGSLLEGRTVKATEVMPASDQRMISVTPDYATGTYTLHLDGDSTMFSLPDLAPLPDPGTQLVALSDGGSSRLVLFNNLAPVTGTNLFYMQLHYLSFAFLYENDPASTDHAMRALLFGTATPAADLPHSGMAIYNTAGYATALWSNGGQHEVQGKLTVDFASGAIDNSFAILAPFGPSLSPTYRVSGSGAIASGSSAFSGTLTGTQYPLTGSYTGSFFGPAAQEAGFTFAVTGTADGTPQTFVGAAGGKR